MRAGDESWAPPSAARGGGDAEIQLREREGKKKKEKKQLHVYSEAGRRWRTSRCLLLRGLSHFQLLNRGSQQPVGGVSQLGKKN